jgi:EAL domain-containing protein (putative c-di-GMP-specific phosphodiesterase class I)
MTLLGTLTSFPVFNGLQQGELALLTAFLGGLVLMGSIALIILTHLQSVRALHIATMLVAFTSLMPNIWACYALSLVLLGHLLLALRIGSKRLLVSAFVAVLSYLILLSGSIVWFWPIQYVLLPLFIIYASQFFEFSLVLSHQNQAKMKEHTAVSKPDILGLPDRAGLREAYYQYSDKESAPLVLVMIRLEGFEQVNFHLGREYGDLLLAQSANRIKQHLQHADIVSIQQGTHFAKLAHLGGLHFVFLCSLEHQQHLHEQMIGAIVQSTLKPFNVGNCTIEIKARASYVPLSAHNNDFDNAITCAFLALDSDPKKVVTEYQTAMQTAKQEQQARLAELTHHNFRDQLELYFQPVIRHSDNGIEFLELLLRWQHPKQGILAAGKFIDDIRIAGLALPVAQYVIERAAEIAMALKMEGIKMALSVNVFGPEMLHEEFIEFLDDVLLTHHLEAGDLIIECPSALFMSLDAQGVAMIARLRSIGVRLCVDGFGEAPLILAKLPKLTVDYVKVGQSLTRDHQHQGALRGIVRGLVDMQHQLDCAVICEGVESLEQLNFAQSLNTFAAQGYYFERPLSSVGMLSWIKQYQLEHHNLADHEKG